MFYRIVSHAFNEFFVRFVYFLRIWLNVVNYSHGTWNIENLLARNEDVRVTEFRFVHAINPRYITSIRNIFLSLCFLHFYQFLKQSIMPVKVFPKLVFIILFWFLLLYTFDGQFSVGTQNLLSQFFIISSKSLFHLNSDTLEKWFHLLIDEGERKQFGYFNSLFFGKAFFQPLTDFWFICFRVLLQDLINRITSRNDHHFQINKGNTLYFVEVKNTEQEIQLVPKTTFFCQYYQSTKYLQCIHPPWLFRIPHFRLLSQTEYLLELFSGDDECVTNRLEDPMVFFDGREGLGQRTAFLCLEMVGFVLNAWQK